VAHQHIVEQGRHLTQELHAMGHASPASHSAGPDDGVHAVMGILRFHTGLHGLARQPDGLVASILHTHAAHVTVLDSFLRPLLPEEQRAA
jgi:hypothetical protein